MGGYVVVGLKRSGVAAANLLAMKGHEVTVTDLASEAELVAYIKALDPRVSLALGRHPEGLFTSADTVVLSPGVPHTIAPVMAARRAGAEIIGEVELAYREAGGVPFFAVTGTNGKSTTVSLLAGMFGRSGGRCLLAGNIGTALTAEVAAYMTGKAPRPDTVVAEVSSFQLDTIYRFRPRGAAILNITPDHMDRYDSPAHYAASKARICLNQQDGDYLVLNADDPECMKLRENYMVASMEAAGRVYYFSTRGPVKGVWVDGAEVVFEPTGSGRLVICRTPDIFIKGLHNLENALAAAAMALLGGCHPENVADELSGFRGLEHRLEFVRELDGVTYVNDSKGTNVGAVLKSLQSFGSSPIILIAGGRDKAGDFPALAELASRHMKAAVLIGEAAAKLRTALEGATKCVDAGGMHEAVSKARAMAVSGDVVLLSPACASFDMFRDFEHRGRVFKEAVASL